ncbi:MAG: nitroreductase/quinone reductase family protein [Dehalococcoidia bacterium]
MEVVGRRSGRPRSTVLVLAGHHGQKYAVSVVGERSDWIQNVRAANGHAVIHHGRRRKVMLSEVPVGERAPILKAYVKWSLGARAVMDLGPDSEIERFEAIAGQHPVFRITDGTPSA